MRNKRLLAISAIAISTSVFMTACSFGGDGSLEMAKAALPYADGLYLMTPFNRVALMERLIGRLKQEVLGAY